MKFFTSALLALAALPSVFGANQQLPDGILGIKMDKADPKGVPGVKAGMTFSSKVIFKDDVWNTLLDGAKRDAQLAGLAQNAYWQMTKAEGFPGGDEKRDRPYAMTALAVGKTIYFSSSMKGGGHFILKGKDPNHPLRLALNQCQIAFETAHQNSGKVPRSEHKNNAACGEVMTMYAYIQDQKAANLAHDLSNAVAVTVRNPNSKKQDTLQFDDIEVFDPCGTDQIDVNSPAYQGCAQLTSVMGVKTITSPMAFESFTLPVDMEVAPVHLDCVASQGWSPPATS